MPFTVMQWCRKHRQEFKESKSFYFKELSEPKRLEEDKKIQSSRSEDSGSAQTSSKKSGIEKSSSQTSFFENVVNNSCFYLGNRFKKSVENISKFLNKNNEQKKEDNLGFSTNQFGSSSFNINNDLSKSQYQSKDNLIVEFVKDEDAFSENASHLIDGSENNPITLSDEEFDKNPDENNSLLTELNNIKTEFEHSIKFCDDSC